MGNPFVHVELNTSDTVKARKFYGSLFDWKLSDAPMGPDGVYTMIDVGTVAMGSGGGIQKSQMLGAAPAWLSYVAVESVKKTIAKAKKLGARIIVDYHDVGMGVLGIFSDPTGAVLGVWEPRPATPPPASRPAPEKAEARPASKPAPRAKPATKPPAAKAKGKAPAAKAKAKAPAAKKRR